MDPRLLPRASTVSGLGEKIRARRAFSPLPSLMYHRRVEKSVRNYDVHGNTGNNRGLEPPRHGVANRRRGE